MVVAFIEYRGRTVKQGVNFPFALIHIIIIFGNKGPKEIEGEVQWVMSCVIVSRYSRRYNVEVSSGVIVSIDLELWIDIEISRQND